MSKHDGVIRVRVNLLSCLALAAFMPLAAHSQGWGTYSDPNSKTEPIPPTVTPGGIRALPPAPLGRPWGEIPPEFGPAPAPDGIPERRQKSYSEYLWEREYFRRFGRMPDERSGEKAPEVLPEPPLAPPPQTGHTPGNVMREPWDAERPNPDYGRDSPRPAEDPRWQEQWPPYGGGMGPMTNDPRWPPQGDGYRGWGAP